VILLVKADSLNIGWFGWHGGYSIVKKSKDSADGRATEQRSHLARRESLTVLDPEKHLPTDDHHHKHGHDNMAAVNAMDAEKSLELAAAEGGFNDRKEMEQEDSTSSEGRESPTR
jgi:hypothetical protein